MGVATLALCRFASSWSHTSARVTGLQPFALVSAHSRHARHWSHHRISGGDCTASHDPTNRPYRLVRPRAAGPSVSCASPPLGQLPRAVCAGDLPLSCDPTKVFICPLASHLQRLGSSRHAISTQHTFPLRPQLTMRVHYVVPLSQDGFLHRSSGRLRVGKAAKVVAPVPGSETKCYAPAERCGVAQYLGRERRVSPNKRLHNRPAGRTKSPWLHCRGVGPLQDN